MSAWNAGPFDNDDASDWLYELEQSSDISVITAALGAVAGIGDDYLEAPECSMAIAAAEIVSALCGRSAEDLPDHAIAWVEEHQGLDVSALVQTAEAVIERIGSNSELKELWEETEHAGKWHASLTHLAARLDSLGSC